MSAQCAGCMASAEKAGKLKVSMPGAQPRGQSPSGSQIDLEQVSRPLCACAPSRPTGTVTVSTSRAAAHVRPAATALEQRPRQESVWSSCEGPHPIHPSARSLVASRLQKWKGRTLEAKVVESLRRLYRPSQTGPRDRRAAPRRG